MTVLLWILVWVLGGVASGVVTAWWRDRHPFEIEIRLHEDGHVVVATDQALSKGELLALEAAVKHSERLVLDANVHVKSWRLGAGPLPSVARQS